MSAKKPLHLVTGHRTQEEKAQRAAQDVKTPTPTRTPAPPKYLPENMKKDFRSYARQLVALEIFAALDVDTLARYLIARAAWVQAQNRANRAIAQDDMESASAWTKLSNTYFSQCHQCAAALGLNIGARCRLIIPRAPEQDQANDPMARLLQSRAGGSG